MLQPHQSSSPSTWKGAALGSLVIVAAVLAVFGRVVFHDFAGFDDAMCLYWNPHLGRPLGPNVRWYASHAYMHLYTPVIFAVWNVLAVVGGRAGPAYLPRVINPQAFHAASLFAHAVNALLVFALLRKLVKRDLAAVLGALLFALHPIQVEAVAWASGLKDLLCTTFSLISLYLYLPPANLSHAGSGASGDGPDSPSIDELGCHRSRYPETCAASPAERHRSRRTATCGTQTNSRTLTRQFASVTCLLLAILCKPAAVTVPILAAILDRFLLRTPTHRVARKILPLLLVAGAMAIVGRYVQPKGQLPLIALAWRPLIAADALNFYLTKLALPWHFAVAYGRSPAAAQASGDLAWTWLLPASLAAAVWAWRKNRPWLVASALVFALAPLPVLGWIRFDYQRLSTVADHYAYLALLGPALLLAAGFRFVRSRALLSICACVLVALAINSSHQLSHWRTNVAVWQHAVALTPTCREAHENLASAYQDLGPAYANDQARELAIAVQLKPNEMRNRDLLVGALLTAGRTDDAIAEMLAITHLQERADRPGDPLPSERLAAYLSLGDLLLAKNRPDEAADMFRRILRQLPHDPTARKHIELCVFRLPRQKAAAPVYLGAAE